MNYIRIIILAMLIAGSSNVKSQSPSATANAFATIVTPITISKNQDINFGNLDVQSLNGGKVILSPDGFRTVTSGVSLPSNAGAVSAADFTVMGSNASTFSIDLPATVMLVHSSGMESMIADSFTSTPSGSGVLTGGSEHIKIGATLAVAAAQRPGIYTSQGFEVTVNYN